MDQLVKIESGIPIPSMGTWTEVVRKMNYGDSVLLPVKEAAILRNCIRRSGAHAVQRRCGNDIRVWKMKKPVVHRNGQIRQVMSELGSRKKTMTPAALEARRSSAQKSAAARRK